MLRHYIALGVVLSAAAPSLVNQVRLGPAPTPGPSRVVLTTSQPSFFLGENVLVHYCLENASTDQVSINTGGDYHGPRSMRFAVRVTDQRGQVMPDPGGFTLGGLSGTHQIGAGERWCESLPLMRYVRIDRPGTYDVRVTHDLGWPKGQAPEGRLRLTFAMPTPEEAERLIQVVETLPVESFRLGQNQPSLPYADYTALRYAVYFDPLVRRVEAGQAWAVAGLGAIPTPDATQRLIRLATSSDRDIARPAAQALAARLPDPEPPRNPPMDDMAVQVRDLRNASWRPEFVTDVRDAARRLLTSEDVRDIRQGAFFLRATGQREDAPDLSAALTRAIERTVTTSFDERGHPRPRGAAEELMRAADVIVRRGYAAPASPETPGDIALWLTALGRGARPSGWQAAIARALVHPIAYVREVALEKMPDDVQESLVSGITVNLDAPDLDVQIAACRLVDRARITTLRAPLTGVVQRAKDSQLRRAAENALMALGGRIDVLEIRARRLVEADIAKYLLGDLIFVFDISGTAGGDVAPADAAELSQRWLTFIAAHRAELERDVPLSLDRSDIPVDLVPAGWVLNRRGRPDWPPR